MNWILTRRFRLARRLTFGCVLKKYIVKNNKITALIPDGTTLHTTTKETALHTTTTKETALHTTTTKETTTQKPWATKEPPCPNTRRRHSAVASDATDCSAIGLKYLNEYGGSAIDSMIATTLCMSLFNAHSMGIGGGFFMTYYSREQRVAYTFDARETAPAASTSDMFYPKPGQTRGPSSIHGGLSIGVPGTIKGYYVAHRMFGKLPWSHLFNDSIRLATEGFAISADMYEAMVSQYSHVRQSPVLSRILLDSNGNRKPIGSIIRMPELANTLRRIQESPDDFYNGELADRVVDEVRRSGGIISKDDLKNYEVNVANSKETDGTRCLVAELSKTIPSSWYPPLRLFTLQPPSSGAVLAYILKVLDSYGGNAPWGTTQNISLSLHRLIEASKFAYARRLSFGDLTFDKSGNLTELVKNMVSSAYADETRKLISDTRTQALPFYLDRPGVFPGTTAGTGHLSLIAPNGDAVSVTSTINYKFGSFVVGNSTGIIYNDEMDDFSTTNQPNIYGFPPSEENKVEPGKRPQSSMSPSIIVDRYGKVRMVIGAAGGSRIISSIAQVTAEVLMFRQSIESSISFPRVHNQYTNETKFEPSLDANVVSNLRTRGQTMVPFPQGDLNFNTVQGITVDHSGAVQASSDQRKRAESRQRTTCS